MKEKIQKLLSDKKLKNTETRARVLEAFLLTKHALSNQDLENNFEYVDRVTLYRTLKTFEEKGIIHQALDGTDKNKYALCSENCSSVMHHDSHAHFTCSVCASTICLDDVQIPELKIPQGFSLESTNVILNGICNACTN